MLVMFADSDNVRKLHTLVLLGNITTSTIVFSWTVFQVEVQCPDRGVWNLHVLLVVDAPTRHGYD